MKHENRTFTNETISVDGNEYRRCVFNDCQFVFSATAPVVMDSCSINGGTWALAGAAALTVKFMTAQYHGGFKDLIEAAFENIRGRSAPGISIQ